MALNIVIDLPLAIASPKLALKQARRRVRNGRRGDVNVDWTPAVMMLRRVVRYIFKCSPKEDPDVKKRRNWPRRTWAQRDIYKPRYRWHWADADLGDYGLERS